MSGSSDGSDAFDDLNLPQGSSDSRANKEKYKTTFHESPEVVRKTYVCMTIKEFHVEDEDD